jgi:hypothetical protein
MTGKPFQSILIPHQEEIARLRSQKPSVSYSRISDLLLQKYGLSIRRGAIAKFVKRRSGGRKVYFFKREIEAKKPAVVQPAEQSVHTGSCSQAGGSNAKPQSPKPKFEFKYSERYNLKRLPPEEAEAIRKELEKEGH